MKIYSSYKVKIKHYNKIFSQTVEVYRNAVSFFIDICEKEWEVLEPLNSFKLISSEIPLALADGMNGECITYNYE